MNTLKAEKRDMKRKARQLRREGYVTGSIFGKNLAGAVSVQMNVLEVDAFLKENWEGSEVLLNVDGQEMPAIIKEIQYSFLKHEFLEVDFQTITEPGSASENESKDIEAAEPSADNAAAE